MYSCKPSCLFSCLIITLCDPSKEILYSQVSHIFGDKTIPLNAEEEKGNVPRWRNLLFSSLLFFLYFCVCYSLMLINRWKYWKCFILSQWECSAKPYAHITHILYLFSKLQGFKGFMRDINQICLDSYTQNSSLKKSAKEGKLESFADSFSHVKDYIVARNLYSREDLFATSCRELLPIFLKPVRLDLHSCLFPLFFFFVFHTEYFSGFYPKRERRCPIIYNHGLDVLLYQSDEKPVSFFNK